MRFRSLILCACMVVVPLLAMFSHRVPPQVAAVVRQRLWEPVVAWAGWSRSPFPPPARPAAEAAPAPAGQPVVATPAVVPVAAPPPALPAMPTPAQAVAAGGRRAVEDRLLRLGARSIECGPLRPGDATIVASCRVAVDPAGELQRVFQATADEPTAALERLLGDVEAWRRPIASRPPAAAR